MNEVLNKIQSILDCMHQTDWAHNPDKFVLIMRTDLFREFQEIGIRRVYHLWGFNEDDRIPEDTADGLTSSDIHINQQAPTTGRFFIGLKTRLKLVPKTLDRTIIL